MKNQKKMSIHKRIDEVARNKELTLEEKYDFVDKLTEKEIREAFKTLMETWDMLLQK